MATIKAGTVTFEHGEATGAAAGSPGARRPLNPSDRPHSLSARAAPPPDTADCTPYGGARDPVRPPGRHPRRLPGLGAGTRGGRDSRVDVLEFNSGLMISIDETIDEPNWLRYTERVGGVLPAAPLRRRRPRAVRSPADGHRTLHRGLGPRRARRDGRRRDATAPCVLASTGGAMAALWLAATHPERVTSLVIVNGTARVGQAEDYGFGVPTRTSADGGHRGGADRGRRPPGHRDLRPSLAHRVGFREWWGRAARRGASPATAVAFNLVTFSGRRALVPARHHVPDPGLCPRSTGLRQPERARPVPRPSTSPAPAS